MLPTFREQMDVHPDFTYFDHAGVSPLSGPARRAIEDWAADIAQYGVTNWRRWRGEVEQARLLGAELMGARPQEIALIHSTTEGINLVSEGFPWQAGDNVVVPAEEFPSNLYPWRMLESRGVEVRLVEMPPGRLDLDRIRAACDRRTRIVTASWVGFSSGYRVDLAALSELVHEAGALLFVDAIQGLGVFPLNLQEIPIDFLAADSHKWMLGPEGCGLFFVREEHLDLLRPLGIGWNSVRTAGDFHLSTVSLKPSAGRYEGGTYNMPGITGMAASLKLLLDHGIDQVSAAIHRATDETIEALRSIGADICSDRSEQHWSGIVSFDLPGRDPDAIREHATKHHVVLNSRGGHVRIAPHAYTNQDDIARLVDVLQAF